MLNRWAKPMVLLIFALGLSFILDSKTQAASKGRSKLDQGSRGICSSVSEIPVSECEALVSFYQSTKGPGWALKRGWLEIEYPCNWAGIECKDGHVIAILMNYNDLKGTLPPELGALSELQTLTLYFNYLSGPLPPELGNLSKLETLILHNNDLSGPIPANLGNLTSLRILDLESNNLSGPIPAELGRLTNLETLNLNDNHLSGPIPPELGNLSKLKGLFLAGNDLSGSVPPELGNLSNLWMFNVSGNHLSGNLPPNLQKLPGSGYDFFKWNKSQSPPPTATKEPAAEERPLMQPYPFTTPLPPPVATLLDNTYLRDVVTIKIPPVPCRRCAPYKLEGGEWTLSLEKGVFRVAHPITGFRSVGSFTVSGDKVTFFNDPNCYQDVGIYTWSLEGSALRLKVVDDPCGFGLRAKNFTAFSWIRNTNPPNPAQEKDPCQPPSLEAAISGHWPIPLDCNIQ